MRLQIDPSVDFVNRWLQNHIAESVKLKKPLILEEFGKVVKVRDSIPGGLGYGTLGCGRLGITKTGLHHLLQCL